MIRRPVFHSIRTKLTVLMVSVSAVVVFLTAALLTAAWYQQQYKLLEQDLLTLARMTGENCQAALTFEIVEDAERLLTVLQYRPSIRKAVVLDASGKRFAEFLREGRIALPVTFIDSGTPVLLADGALWVHLPIQQHGRILGSILLMDDLSSIREVLRKNILNSIWLTIAVVLGTVLLALRVQRVVSAPIASLASAAREVSRNHDYSVQVERTTQDETGELVDAFNDMLDQVRRRNAQVLEARNDAEARAVEAEQARILLEDEVEQRCRAEAEILSLNRDLEHRVRQRTAELTASNEEMEAFCYSVSHDLRAPLRSLDGFSQVLEEDYSATLDAAAQDYLGRLRRAARRMGELIDALLGLSRITRESFQREPVDVGHLARQAFEDLCAPEDAGRISFHVMADMWAEADAKLLRAALANLLNNALKFTRASDQPRIEIGQQARNRQSVYFIRDNGMGFDMRHADKLFEPFQRLHSDPSIEGTGIGLATVHRIIRRHGGTIWAEGRPGEGAVFYFTLEPDLEVDVESGAA